MKKIINNLPSTLLWDLCTDGGKKLVLSGYIQAVELRALH
jgi:hypothetical protein